ncbi:MAG: hypothetical protein KY464_05225 [Gemmatimonadetes bacterium]|nr:hypothetical protein [Gemmatimonadota bacterium]
MLLRYRYFQPIGGLFHYQGGGAANPEFALIYAGSIPVGEADDTEEVLERLWLRHTAELRPHGRAERPLGTGDVLDLGERGLWQASSLGFRALTREELRLEEAA